MKIYNEDKSQELNYNDLDFTAGYLENKKETVHHDAVEEVEEKGHYETIAEYPNGGKDVKWVIDVPGVTAQDAYDEEIEYGIYILFTKDDIRFKECLTEIDEYKQLLNKTDYLAIKYAEGWLTAEEYAPIKAERQGYRDKVNELQEEIDKLRAKGVHE